MFKFFGSVVPLRAIVDIDHEVTDRPSEPIWSVITNAAADRDARRFPPAGSRVG